MAVELSAAKIIVTGGSSGLGAACVAHFRGQGARVSVFDLSAEGPDAYAVDVTAEEAVAQAVDAASIAMDGVTAVVNCAGIAVGAKTFGKNGPHDLGLFRKTIDVNLIGSFNVSRLAAAEMAKNDPNADGERGVIVNTASVAAFDGQKGQAAYAASKAGIAGMSLPMARDLAGFGIRVCAIAPGIFLTPMLEGLGEEIIAGLSADVLFPKRLGKPEEFAQLAGFIISAPYLNGETIRMDGGLRMQ